MELYLDDWRLRPHPSRANANTTGGAPKERRGAEVESLICEFQHNTRLTLSW